MNTAPAPDLFARDIHPRLLFGPDDLPALREKAKHGIPARALSELLRRSEQWTSPASPFNPALGRDALLNANDPKIEGGVGAVLHVLAFSYAFTGEQRWADHAAAIFRVLCAPGANETSWHNASLEGEFPMAFDLLAPALSPGDRKLVETYLRRGVELGEQQLLNRPGPRWSLGTNLFLHPFEQYVMMLGACYRPEVDAPRLARVADMARLGFHLGLDEGGAIYEGPSYGTGDATWMTTVAEILFRAGVADFWKEEPRFANLIRHWVWLILPGHRGQNTVGDAWRYKTGHPHWAAPMHARRLKDDTFWWVWERMRSRTTQGKSSKAPECIHYRLGWTVLYEDESATIRQPSDTGPMARNSGGFGVVTMRSGWGDEDLYFSLLAAGRTPGVMIHQHVDAGHFSLFALNEAFSIDTGYGDILGRFHSVMMPLGEEPPAAPRNFDQMWLGGRVHAFAAGKGTHYACVDVHEAWGCRSAFRHAMLVRGPKNASAATGGDIEPYVILVDDFNHSANLSNYLWLMNSEPGNRIEIDAADERVTIHGQKHRLEIAWSHPSPADYPIQHRMELETDHIDSMPLPHRPHDINYFMGEGAAQRPRGGGRWGAGVRPRVKATLWGYNGQLLTALLPCRAGTPSAKVERIFAPAHFGMTIHHGSAIDTIVTSPFERRLDLGGVRGEALLAIVRRDLSGRVLWWAAAEAYGLAIDGKTVKPREGAATTLIES